MTEWVAYLNDALPVWLKLLIEVAIVVLIVVCVRAYGVLLTSRKSSARTRERETDEAVRRYSRRYAASRARYTEQGLSSLPRIAPEWIRRVWFGVPHPTPEQKADEAREALEESFEFDVNLRRWYAGFKASYEPVKAVLNRAYYEQPPMTDREAMAAAASVGSGVRWKDVQRREEAVIYQDFLWGIDPLRVIEVRLMPASAKTSDIQVADFSYINLKAIVEPLVESLGVEDPEEEADEPEVHQDMRDVDEMGGVEFEVFCRDLLLGNGFDSAELTPATNDQGVDIVATMEGRRYAIQCKRYAGRLGNRPVQEVLLGKVYYKCDEAVVMTNSTFTRGGMDAARSAGVLLWDRSRIRELIDG